MKDTTITDTNMMDVYKKIGSNVKEIRKSKGVTQLKLALAMGFKAVGTVSLSELCIQGKHFNIEHLVKIADILEVDVRDFFKDI